MPGEAAAHQLLAQLHVDLGAERAGLGQPCGAHRLEAVAPPLGQPRAPSAAVSLSSGRLDRAAERTRRDSASPAAAARSRH